MKPIHVLFGLSLAMAGCQHRGPSPYTLTDEDFDRMANGVVFEDSWRSNDHADPGIYPGPVIASANGKLQEKIYSMTKDSLSEAFIIPTPDGIAIKYLTRKRLTPEQRKEMDDYVDVALQEAGREEEAYRKKSRPNQSSTAQRP